MSDIGRMAVLCELHLECVGFNSHGWLKWNSTITNEKSTVDFYVRKQPRSRTIGQ